MTSYIQVVTTVAEKSQAQDIARELLARQLAACVQISPCQSVYRWQGSIEEESEYCCVLKSREDLFTELCKAIEDLHPYDVPEILALPVLAGADSYLTWLDQELLPIKK